MKHHYVTYDASNQNKPKIGIVPSTMAAPAAPTPSTPHVNDPSGWVVSDYGTPPDSTGAVTFATATAFIAAIALAF